PKKGEFELTIKNLEKKEPFFLDTSKPFKSAFQLIKAGKLKIKLVDESGFILGGKNLLGEFVISKKQFIFEGQKGPKTLKKLPETPTISIRKELLIPNLFRPKEFVGQPSFKEVFTHELIHLKRREFIETQVLSLGRITGKVEKPFEITKKGSFKGLLGEQFGLGEGLNIKITGPTKTIGLKDILKQPRVITKAGSFRDLITESFGFSKGKSLGVGLELITRPDIPIELRPFAPGGVEIRKRASLKEAIRFLGREEPPLSFDLKIPRARLDIVTKEVGEGIGFGEVTTRGFRSRFFDLRFVRLGPQRAITAREIEEPKLLEGPRKKVIKGIEEELEKQGARPVVTFDRRGVPIAPLG
ncbi:hypothetical protein LCGC14_3045680, partial [marine sediment metagenome]